MRGERLPATADGMSGALRVWACGCSHVAADKAAGRESLADAIRQSETGDGDPHLAFDWDVCLNLGDFSAAHGLPTEEEGEEIVRQFGALTRHRREDVYTLCGNHDRGAPGEPPGRWFRRYVDPFGENTAVSGVDRGRYRHPVHGDWERYWFEVGNVRFLMMSDVNEPSQPLGRGALGGNPGGVVSGETFDWWVDQVTSRHRDRIIVTAHHYVLKETTVASGDWEGMSRGGDGGWKTEYHGYHEQGTPRGASYLYWVAGRPDGGAFEAWLDSHPGTVDLWIGAHTHTDPDDMRGGKSHVETRYGGATFVNAAALTRHFVSDHAMPISRLLTFEDGSDLLRIACYMHTGEHRPKGFYRGKERTIRLTKPFRADDTGRTR